MTTKYMVNLVDSLSFDETRQVRDAYRHFLENFNCELCPALDDVGSQNDVYRIIVPRQPEGEPWVPVVATRA